MRKLILLFLVVACNVPTTSKYNTFADLKGTVWEEKKKKFTLIFRGTPAQISYNGKNHIIATISENGGEFEFEAPDPQGKKTLKVRMKPLSQKKARVWFKEIDESNNTVILSFESVAYRI